jgi:hypothetical protein
MAAAKPHPKPEDKSPTMVELVDDESADPSKAKIDVAQLSEADQEFYRKYGRVPEGGAAAAVKKRENKKQFDSADYFMAAEKAKSEAGGEAHPPPQQKNLPPHLRKKVPPHLR